MHKQQLKTECNSQKLELFLRGSLSNSETEILELHLTECESCASQIQHAAEQGVSWQDAQSRLMVDEYDSPQHVASISSLFSDDHSPMTKRQTAEVLSREIRGWLDASDDPRSMGRFAGYEIVGIVGHGGMGIVLKGFEASLNRYVAIKILAPRLATNGSARKRFAREAQAAAAVRHDNVIAIHRVDEWHGLPFLVMPYAGGISLQKRIDCDGPLSIEQTLRVGVQIASGLAAAHAQGLIHRDIKPANILLEQGVERVTITDFGLARAADDASVTRTGIIAGTPQYMSPEQAEARQLDARSDLFSLGSVLYAMATGRSPFPGTGSFEVLKHIVNDPARPMREIQSSVPEWFERIVTRLHSKSPNDRPSSASEVAQVLQECLAYVQQPTATSLPGSLTAAAQSDDRNRRPRIVKFIASGTFAFLMILAGILIVLEMDKGTLTIESEVDNVPIRIMQGDKVVEKMTISASGKAVRVAAGQYTIEIDDSVDNLVVHDGNVSLKRGSREVVRISNSAVEGSRRISSPIEQIDNLPENTEVHVVGCYHATNNEPVNVRVERTGKPIVVVLTAYFATSWNLEIDQNTDVRGVILSGYFDQRFSHIAPKDIPTRILTYFPIWKDISSEEKKVRVSQCFFVWSPILEDFGKMRSLVREITQRDVASFQGIYSAKSFVIDGQRGAGEAQVAARWQALSERADQSTPGYRKINTELKLVHNDDNGGLSFEQLRRLNQLMDTYERELKRNGDSAVLEPSDQPRNPEPIAMGKTLRQLQGKWRLTRQIADDGDEKSTPARAIWEFNGNRIIVTDGGPGGVMLIELDESHSPVHVDVTLEGEDQSGLGLLSLDGDKLTLCLGESQELPEQRSRPEKLQWVKGVWLMELQRLQPGESVAMLNPKAPVAPTDNLDGGTKPSNSVPGTMPEPSTVDPAHTITGFVMEFRSGTADVPVCLCDAATGLPVAKNSYKPIVWSKGLGGNPAQEMAIAVSDEKGNFRFDDVPDGKYRLIAQKWMGPYKGVFELHGAEIRLMGAADEIIVPRPTDEQASRAVLIPHGENAIQFNQDVGNNETFLFLSTAPPEFDPILGLQGLGTAFWKNLIGVNRMPLGKTTVTGAPNKPVYAFLFAADNSPGFAAITIPPPETGMVRLPPEPFVAGWSDGRKTPPPKLAELMEFMKKHELSTQRLLEIPEMSNANFKAYQARVQELWSDLSRVIELPEGQTARIGDLLAADAYFKLQK